MRIRLLFLFAFFSVIFSTQGQITLSQSDLASPGNVLVDQSTSFPGAVPPGGANQTWDFTSVGDTLFTDTTLYKAPSATPYAATMTGSNLAAVSLGSYQFFEKSSTGFFFRGFVFELPPLPINLPFTAAPFNITPKIPVVKFPGTYGQVNTGTGEGSFEFDYDTTISGINITKVRLIATITIEDTIDGWGDAVFPAETIPCLRQTQWQKMSFRAQGYTQILPPPFPAVWVPLPVTLPGFGSKNIMWWANGKKAPVATFSFDTNGISTGTRFQRSLLTPTGTLGKLAKSEFDVYPNPTQNLVFWSENIFPKHVKIFSSDGKLQKAEEVISSQKSLRLDDLPNGLYWLEVENEDGKFGRKRLVVNR